MLSNVPNSIGGSDVSQVQMFEEPGEGEPDPRMVADLIEKTKYFDLPAPRRLPIPVGIDTLAREVKVHADTLFPGRTDASMFLKIYGETAEVIDSNGAADEIADIFIMWLDYAARKGVNIEAAVRAKMLINSKRSWVKTEAGVFQHVE